MVHRVSVATNTLAYMSVYRRLVHGPYLTIPLRILQLNFPGPSRLQTRRRSRGKGDRSLTAMAQLYAPNASLIIVDTPFHTHIYKLIFFFFFLHFHCRNNILVYMDCSGSLLYKFKSFKFRVFLLYDLSKFF